MKVTANEVSPNQIKAERLQTRAATHSNYVDEIAERMSAGDIFPPIVIFTDGKESWIADGIHRLDGAIKAKKKIGVDERKGTRADAVEFACGANAAHGLRRTNADKRRAVSLALSQFSERSSRAIADLCGVSNHLVEELRTASATGRIPSWNKNTEKTRLGKDGKRRPASKSDSTCGQAGEADTLASDGQCNWENSQLEQKHQDEPLEDAVGQAVPEKLHTVFSCAAAFDEQSRALGAVKKWAAEMTECSGGSYLHLQSFAGQLTAAQKQLKFERPYAVCPYCQAKKPKCSACKGRGFVTKSLYDSAPAEMRV